METLDNRKESQLAARKRVTEPKRTRRRPATTPEGRENQIVSDALDLAERQIQDGSASSQVLTHFLRLGSSREKLEQERLDLENRLSQAKRDDLESRQRVEEMYKNALDAMRAYSGNSVHEDEDPDLYRD